MTPTASPDTADRELARALVLASHLVRDLVLALDLARDLSRNLDHVLALNLDLDRAYARNVACDVFRDLARARERAYDLVLALELGLGLDLARDLARDLALALERDLGHDIDIALGLEWIRALAVELGRFSESATQLERSVVPESVDRGTDSAAQVQRVRVNRQARYMTSVAARLLPIADRSRYAEEYEAELYELARVSHRSQWTYAARLLVCAPFLRHVLQGDVREAVQGL